MEQNAPDAAAKAAAFANGLRKSISVNGNRWSQWPNGANDLAAIVARIDQIRADLVAPGADVAACIADLRSILEWSTYQSAAVATARALLTARKTRNFAEQFGLMDSGVPAVASLVDAEDSLIENIRTKNAYMEAIAERHPHLVLPQPLVRPESLAAKIAKKPGRLDLIQQLMKSKKKK